MLTVYSEQHALRNARTELHCGELVTPHESPRRAAVVLDRVHEARLGPVIAPETCSLDAVLRVHDRGFVDFLANAWSEWSRSGNRGEAIPDSWPARRMQQRVPTSITGRLGYYAMDSIPTSFRLSSAENRPHQV
jgi:acetoin utilization deacetylase AcuC-like enzyme